MNYSLSVSNSTTSLMEEQGITDPEEALSMVLKAAQREFLAGGDISMGSIILLVDCDTRSVQWAIVRSMYKPSRLMPRESFFLSRARK